MWVDCTDLPWVVCGSAILKKTPHPEPEILNVLRTSEGSVAHFSAPPRDEDHTDSPTGLISLVCKS